MEWWQAILAFCSATAVPLMILAVRKLSSIDNRMATMEERINGVMKNHAVLEKSDEKINERLGWGASKIQQLVSRTAVLEFRVNRLDNQGRKGQ
jgi:chromosome segregation ATPase